ncbi:MAG: LysM peptidoglycan-binding domain-containing protein [Chloroflexota bacterium]
MNALNRRRTRKVYRIRGNRFGRLVTALFLCAACLGSLAMITAPHLRPAAASPRLLEVTVDTGDTLWGLASRYSPTTKDIRSTVSEILRINRLASAELQPGQVILVPGR